MIAEWYWRLFSAWHALFEAPTRAETIEHCALEAHKRQEEIDEAFALGYLNGYDDAMEFSAAEGDGLRRDGETCECDGVSIERMIDDLLRAGWEKYHGSTWRTPWGAIYLGPCKAWHVWAGVPMCRPK